MAFWRDVRKGVRLECDGTAISIGGLALPRPPATVVSAFFRPCVDQYGHVAAKSDGYAYLYDGGGWQTVAGTPPPDGPGYVVTAWGAAIDYSRRVLWIEWGKGVRRRSFDPAETPEDGVAPYSSAGILDVQPDDDIVMDGVGSTFMFRAWNGTTIAMPKACLRGDWVAGYAMQEPTGVVVGQISTGRLWQAWEGDPQSLPIRLDDDGQTVAISGQRGGFIIRDQWRAILLPDPIPDPPPSSKPRPLTRPTLFGVFQRGTWPQWANAVIDITPGVTPQMLVGDTAEDDAAEAVLVRWNVYDTESHTGIRTSPCCYIGSPESIIAEKLKAVGADDVLSPWIYPEGGESDADFTAKADDAIRRTRLAYPGSTIAPIWRVDTRINNQWQPTLTENQVRRCLVIASQFTVPGTTLGLPALFFQGDRAGFVQAAVDDLQAWRNGWPCQTPTSRPPDPPQPTPHGLAARLVMLQ